MIAIRTMTPGRRTTTALAIAATLAVAGLAPASALAAPDAPPASPPSSIVELLRGVLADLLAGDTDESGQQPDPADSDDEDPGAAEMIDPGSIPRQPAPPAPDTVDPGDDDGPIEPGSDDDAGSEVDGLSPPENPMERPAVGGGAPAAGAALAAPPAAVAGAVDDM